MKIRMTVELAAVAATALAAGCGTYYKVTEPTSGHVYYTGDIARKRDGTTIMFTDAKTGAQVILTASEVVAIPSDEFKKAMAK